MPDFLADVTLGQVAAWGGVVTAMVLASRKVWPWLSRFKDFIDDLMGEPPRPGVEARPGVMERLRGHEVEMQQIRALAESADYHSRPNGGGSAYDHLLQEVRGLRDGLEQHNQQAAVRDDRIATLETAVANMAEALPVVARAVPHPVDAHLPAPGPDPAA